MTKRLTDEDLTLIHERSEKATEGPWDDFDEDWDGNVYQYDRLTERSVEIIAECSDNENRLNDAEFIAHAREDIPKLLAEIERLRAQVDDLVSVIYEHTEPDTALRGAAEEAGSNDED